MSNLIKTKDSLFIWYLVIYSVFFILDVILFFHLLNYGIYTCLINQDWCVKSTEDVISLPLFWPTITLLFFVLIGYVISIAMLLIHSIVSLVQKNSSKTRNILAIIIGVIGIIPLFFMKALSSTIFSYVIITFLIISLVLLWIYFLKELKSK